MFSGFLPIDGEATAQLEYLRDAVLRVTGAMRVNYEILGNTDLINSFSFNTNGTLLAPRKHQEIIDTAVDDPRLHAEERPRRRARARGPWRRSFGTSSRRATAPPTSPS